MSPAVSRAVAALFGVLGPTTQTQDLILRSIPQDAATADDLPDALQWLLRQSTSGSKSVLTEQDRVFLEQMRAKHLPGRHDQSTHGRRRPRVTAAVADALDATASVATPAVERPKPKPRRKPDPAPDKPAGRTPAGVPTWEELGRPSGPPPVGQVIGHEGGTYELLPGEPRRYRVTTSDGRDISDQMPIGFSRRNGMDVPSNQTAEDARSALTGDAFDSQRRNADARSRWRKTMEAVPGAYHLDTGEISGFEDATLARRKAIQSALRSWKEDLFDTSRGVEPNVNAALRGRMPRTPKTDADIEALDAAFEMSKASRRITVHRGVIDGQHILPDDWQSRDLTGLEWKDDAYTATSASKDFAKAYVGEPETRGFGINIKLPKGSPAIALPDAIGGLDAEGEIILPRGLTFRVIKDNGVQGRLGMRWLDVEVVSAVKAFLAEMAAKHTPGGVPHDQSSHGHGSGNGSTVARWLSPDDAMAMRGKMLADQPWTQRERDGLNRYSGDAYHWMNGLLRDDQDAIADLSDEDREEYKDLIRDASDGMRPIPQPVKAKRFVAGFESFGLDMSTLTREEAADALRAMKGKVVQDPGLMSTSLAEDYGRETWVGKFKLELDVPEGAPGAYLDGDVGLPQEFELVLAAGSRFEITDVVIDPPRNTVKGRVVVE